MEILPMLARLEQALGCSDLTRQMVLIPKARSLPSLASEQMNLVVAYNGSPKSQTALDLTLWIAHQTRLATRKSVSVQVVYVVDPVDMGPVCLADGFQAEFPLPSFAIQPDLTDRPVGYSFQKLSDAVDGMASETAAACSTGRSLVAELPALTEALAYRSSRWQLQQFDQADRILWQARHLADEWRGSLQTHLRFGSLASELSNVACQEAATVVVLGCRSRNHPLVQAMGEDLPYPVLGIPH